jgi:hypothetical protein
MHITSTHIIWIIVGAFAGIAILCGAMAAHFHDEENKRWDQQ